MLAVAPRSIPKIRSPSRGTSPSARPHVSAVTSRDRSTSDVPRLRRRALKPGSRFTSARASSASFAIAAARSGRCAMLGFALRHVFTWKGGSSSPAAWHCAKSAPPSSIRANQCNGSSGRVPRATKRDSGCFPAAVRRAASIASAVVDGHCAGSSANTSTGARPCARRGSDPMHRTRAPVSRFSIRASCAESQRRHLRRPFDRSRSLSPMKAITCSNAMRA